MLAEITTYTSLRNQAVDSQVEMALGETYLMNTDCIIEMRDESVLALVITNVHYKFDVYEDRTPPFWFRSGDSIASLVTLCDATPASTKIALSVYEDIQTFDMIPNVAAATTWNFNVSDIVWGENDPTDNYARIWVTTGGQKVTPYIVDHNISQLVDKADTGTTTTTTSSTSTTTA